MFTSSLKSKFNNGFNKKLLNTFEMLTGKLHIFSLFIIIIHLCITPCSVNNQAFFWWGEFDPVIFVNNLMKLFDERLKSAQRFSKI
jgi:hypothetical protein